MATKRTPKQRQKWTMPQWMEPYRPLIVNTGGNDIEDMVNGSEDPLINLPLSTLQACVKSQVFLLMGLHDRGMLAKPTRLRTVLERIANSCEMVAPSLPKRLQPGMLAIASEARGALAKGEA